MARGLFVTLEGIDGSGKSTQIARLAVDLRAAGRAVTVTREPGGSTGAEEIRRLLVEGEPGRWSAATELLLFTAARRDHVERTLNPALDAGDVVLCDRYVDSTRAYQGALRDEVDLLHRRLIGLDPDVTLILDLDPEAAFARAAARRGDETRFESHGLAFQKELRRSFLAIAAAEPARCRVIDATRSEDEVAQAIRDALAQKLEAA